ncbi:MAG: ribonuclease HI [Lachnospiraceae bacterium]|nr:ribonuclease HI [Lachnospiraceae bacterium]
MRVTVFSDGSAKGNPGPGGYGTILQYIDTKGRLHELELTEGFRLTTNNRMELLGAIKGLEALKKPCDVTIISDSQYLVNAFNNGWIEGWKKKGWKKADNSEVLNKDLWQRLLLAMESHNVTFEWIKGHAGHPENERCDRLAFNSADEEDLLTDEGYEAKD